MINIDELIIDKDDEGRDKELGRGGFGVVFSGDYHGRKVAIKIPLGRDFFRPKDEKDFDREVGTMEKRRHEAIVEFIGAVKIPKKQVIVTELCPYGSLNEAMNEHPEEFNEQMKVKCLLNTSSAMSYLHSEGTMHRDLNPRNLLVVSLNWRDSVVVKLTDFGNARAEKRMKDTLMTRSVGDSMTLKVGTIAYMAPEVPRLKDYNRSVDVYSFGMLMYTVFSGGRSPFEDKALSGDDPYGKIIAGKRPMVPSCCSKEIRTLMIQCWNGIPSNRPTFDQIHSFFREYFLECRYGSKEGANAARMAEQLLNRLPQLDTLEDLIWTIGGGKEFEQLCELLKTNAIPTRRLEFKGMIEKEKM